MTSFEEYGVNIQQHARTKAQAVHSFNHSCNICCGRGFRINCDRCAIAYAHERQVEALEADAIRYAIGTIVVRSAPTKAVC